jgi:hypothetical protein
MSTRILTRRELSRATLARQMLLRRGKMDVITAVDRLGGLQAQIPRPPYVVLWSRLTGFKRETLTRAIHNRDVVRASLMRATLHLVSRGDFLTMRPLIAPVLRRAMNGVLGARIQTIDIDTVLKVAAEYLDQKPRTFAELRAHVSDRFVGIDERAAGYIVRMVVPLVQVPVEGEPWGYPAAAGFAPAKSWLGEELSPSSAVAPLIRRYLAAFGPATVADFQTWSGLQAARPQFDALREELKVFHNERGQELFDLPQAPRPPAEEDAPVRFLPEFDSVLLAHADRTRVIADAHRPLVVSRNLIVAATLLVDGVVAGTWKVERMKRISRLVISPFARLTSAARKDAMDEGARLLEFIEPEAAERAVVIAPAPS